MSRRTYLFRRVVGLVLALAATAVVAYAVPKHTGSEVMPSSVGTSYSSTLATDALAKLAVKGRAPMTGYSRDQYGDGWATGGTNGACDTRETILRRDLTNIKLGSDGCTVESGTLLSPYTGASIAFTRGPSSSGAVQIDHVVALGDTWQTGAQALDASTRKNLYNDPLELLAVDGPSNNQKGDGDAATWLPANKGFRCYYVARQIVVKAKYGFWVTPAEHDAMAGILQGCPEQKLPQ